MAGFVGYLHTNNREGLLDSMLDTIKHRGPDYRLEYEDDNFYLGYNGLDLSYEFDRKELFEDDELVVLLNGYLGDVDYLIDRYRNLCKKEDYQSPAQIIADLYRLKGEGLAEELKGAFVVVIYHKETSKLCIIRDRFSSQPIYYYQTDGGLIIVSETKSLLEHPDFKKELNEDALVPYLIFQSPTLRETFFKGVFSLPPAAVMTYEKGQAKIDSYWDVDFEERDISLEEAVEKINSLVDSSIEKKTKYFNDRSMIGQSLSGGVDSSYLAASFRPKKTFTVGYDDKEFSEIDNAKDLSDIIGAEHFAEVIDSDKSFGKINDIAYMCDMPFANLSAIPMYFLSGRIEEHTHAVLSGEGADEFFGGYYEYLEPKYMKLYKVLPRGLRRSIGKKMLRSDKDFKGKNFLIKGLPTEDWYIGQAKIFHENEAFSLVQDDFKKAPRVHEVLAPYFEKVKDKTDIQKKQYLDFHVWMANDIVLKADRMNIGHSVQLITPLLDEDLLDFARTLPDEMKIQGDKVKIAFREAALKQLPEDWAKRKKKGYVVPVRKWLKEDKYSEVITEKLTGDLAAKFFDIDMIRKLIDENLSGKRPQHRKLWTIYMFLIWYEEYFIKR